MDIETGSPTWGRCDCSWVETGGVVECGCGEHHIRLYRDVNVIHWRGGHWLPLCAFKKLVEEIDE